MHVSHIIVSVLMGMTVGVLVSMPMGVFVFSFNKCLNDLLHHLLGLRVGIVGGFPTQVTLYDLLIVGKKT